MWVTGRPVAFSRSWNLTLAEADHSDSVIPLPSSEATSSTPLEASQYRAPATHAERGAPNGLRTYSEAGRMET